MEGQAVTTNPWLIMAINMTVVFAVLIALGILMEIVHLIDPTRKKKEAPAATAPVVAMGYSSEQIASIRPTATSAKWRLEGRLSGRG